jgi:hypothetical protein
MCLARNCAVTAAAYASGRKTELSRVMLKIPEAVVAG